jgi:hypothetical protein
MKHTLIGYIAINSLGVPVKSFGTTSLDLEAARAWVKDNAYLHTGLELHEQILSSRRVYKPRTVQLARRVPEQDEFSIPQVPA